MRTKSWSKNELLKAVKNSFSLRQVIKNLGLQPAGGNYAQINKFIKQYKIDNAHFKGKGWNRGMTGVGTPRLTLEQILTKNNTFQSYKLKKRLFKVGLKPQHCEECGWNKTTPDGRLPLELDHINGDNHDNRLVNLRVLCPNCHSLKPTHRGRNRKNNKQ